MVRAQRAGDRRTSIVRLTEKGRTEFEAMAAVHETWVDELLGELVPADVEKVSTVLHDFNLNWGTR